MGIITYTYAATIMIYRNYEMKILFQIDNANVGKEQEETRSGRHTTTCLDHMKGEYGAD